MGHIDNYNERKAIFTEAIEALNQHRKEGEPIDWLENKYFKAIVMWKKRKGDHACPNRKDLLTKRMAATKDQPNQLLEDYLKDRGHGNDALNNVA